MKIIVTGGGGFIGSHVVDYLMSLGHAVVVVDNFFSGRDHWQGQNVRPEIAQYFPITNLQRFSISPRTTTFRSVTAIQLLPMT